MHQGATVPKTVKDKGGKQLRKTRFYKEYDLKRGKRKTVQESAMGKKSDKSVSDAPPASKSRSQ